MTFTIPELVAIAVAILLVGFLLHKYLPTGTVAKIETAASADFAKAETVVRNDAMLAVSRVESWVTDFSGELAAKAKAQAVIVAADASIKLKQDLARSHAAAVLAALPPV